MSAADALFERWIFALLDSGVRFSVLVAAVALTAGAFRIARASARLAVWRWALLGGLLMPVLGAAIPTIAIPVPAGDWVFAAPGTAGLKTGGSYETGGSDATRRSSATAAHVVALAASPTPSARSWISVAGAIYLTGCAILTISAFRRWFAARVVTRGARTINDPAVVSRARAYAAAAGLRSTPRIAASARLVAPVTAGAFRSVILVPESWRSWDNDTLDAVLVHELSHIARRDALVQRVALGYRVINWFNPAAWWLEHRLSSLAEDASDEAVLATSVAPVRYAEILLRFASAASRLRTASWHLAMARVTGAERRIHRVLAWKERPMSRTFDRYRQLIGAALALSLAGVMSAAQIELLASQEGPVLRPAALVQRAAPTLPTAATSEPPVLRPAAPRRSPWAPVAQAPQPLPQAPDDDFAKGAYRPGTPGLTLPEVMSEAKPRYTAEAMRRKLQGSLSIEVVIGSDGVITRARIVEVTGDLESFARDSLEPIATRNFGLDQQALDAVKQWRFKPGMLNGAPVAVRAEVMLEFRLR